MAQSYLQKKVPHRLLIILFMTLIALVLVTACKTTSAEVNTAATRMPEGDMGEPSHEEDMSGMDMEAVDDHDTTMRQFAPNDGAEVLISAPANEASFKLGDTVAVTIETTDFTIGEDGNHWHIYLDGTPIMVMGGNTYVLQNLSAGHHDIEVYLSNGQHQDLEEGDKVTIMVKE
jgi:hypothetical protein